MASIEAFHYKYNYEKAGSRGILTP